MIFFNLLLIALCSIATTLAHSTVTAHDSNHSLLYVGYNSDGVENFQGIRYGQDTSGANRFKHPKAFAYPTGTTIQATAAGASCPQRTLMDFVGYVENEGVYKMSEDCLNLRIARPAGTRPNASLPVMVWIYGGSDEDGSANYTLYDPPNLVLGAAAKHMPVIFVSMNYRVNIFGFANSSALAAEKSQNSGLLDQRLALEWVQENIAAFGGNPKNITIFGQSDGGVSAGLHVTAYGGNGSVPFQRAIMQSGGPAGDVGVAGNFTLTGTSTVAELVGCSGTNSSVVLACLRQVPMTKLLEAVMDYEDDYEDAGGEEDIFFPTLDGTYIPAAPSTLLRTGKFHRNISVIAGWTYNDGSLYVPADLNNASGVQTTIHLSYPGLNSTTLKILISLYPVDDFAAAAKSLNISSYYLQAAEIYRDINFACQSLDVAHHVAQHGSPSYLYELNATSFTSVLEDADALYIGVLHTSDIPYVFNQPDQGLGITAADNITAARMSGSWARFATIGDPSGDGSTALAGWTQAFNRSEAANSSQTIQHASVHVIGGPNAGQRDLKLGGGRDVIEPALLKRCELINSVEFYRQMQT